MEVFPMKFSKQWNKYVASQGRWEYWALIIGAVVAFTLWGIYLPYPKTSSPTLVDHLIPIITGIVACIILAVMTVHGIRNDDKRWPSQ